MIKFEKNTLKNNLELVKAEIKRQGVFFDRITHIPFINPRHNKAFEEPPRFPGDILWFLYRGNEVASFHLHKNILVFTNKIPAFLNDGTMLLISTTLKEKTNPEFIKKMVDYSPNDEFEFLWDKI